MWVGSSANEFVIAQAPHTIRYIPNFITVEEESLLLTEIYAAPKPKWKQLSNRRLQNWGGIVGKTLISDGEIPKWLSHVIDKLMSIPDVFPCENRPNHILINEYKPGQGIMAHTDGPAYYPLISNISLGSNLLIDFFQPVLPSVITETDKSRYIGSLVLQRRSLVLMSDEMYTYYLHEIGTRNTDKITDKVFNREIANYEDGDEIIRDLRVSLTIRNVPVVSKNNLYNILMKKY